MIGSIIYREIMRISLKWHDYCLWLKFSGLWGGATDIFQDYPDVLSIAQVAQALGIGRNAAYDLVNSNKLGCVRIGKIIKVPKFCLEEYLVTARANVKLYEPLANTVIERSQI